MARTLGLSGAEAQEWRVQHALLKQLRQIVRDGALTHAEVAQRGGSSRTRVTAILNGNLNYAVSDREPRVAPNLRLVGSSDDWKRGDRDQWTLHAECRGIELDNDLRCADVESEYVEGWNGAKKAYMEITTTGIFEDGWSEIGAWNVP